MRFSKSLFILAVGFLSVGSVNAETGTVKLERADPSQIANATGHYSRARSLLIAAIREFDKGQKFADPSSLIDTLAWRNTLVDRAEDLEHILSPQPRVSQSGIQYQADSRLVSDPYQK
jgi:hypothetical protein